MSDLSQDLRHAVRGLYKSPGFTAVAVLTLAFGIGGATAMFSVADAVVFRPLPYPDAGQLVFISQTDRDRGTPVVEFSYPAYREWRDRSRQLESFAAMSSVNDEAVLTGRGEPLAIEGRWVTGDFFRVLGTAPALGRTLRLEDDNPKSAAVIVLSHRFWRDRLSANRAVLGESLTIDGKPRTIVGVMPEGFAYPERAQFWVPVAPEVGPVAEMRGIFWMFGIGRLRTAASLESAGTELTGLWRQAHQSAFTGDVNAYSAVLTPLSETIFGSTRAALVGILCAVALVLIMACANVAGLLLVRAARMQPDIAVRQALGATRKRLAFQALTETTVLALAGGVGGLAIAATAIPVMLAMAPSDVPRIESVALNARVFGFALAVSALVAVLSAVAPISLAGKTSLAALPRRAAQRMISGSTRTGSALVVAEVAIAVMVLVATGLVGRSFVKLRQVPLGFESANLLSIRITPKGERYEGRGRVSAFYEELLRRVRLQSGVESAAAITIRPLWSTVGYDSPFTREGQAQSEARRNPHLNLMAVSSEYFRTMGIQLKRGRVLTERDAEGHPGVVVVGESLASRVWPGQDAIGKRIKIPLGDESLYQNAWFTVVGVVSDARYRELQATRLDLYLSHLQAPMPLSYLVARTMGEPTALAAGIRAAVRELDPNVALMEVASMDSIVARALGTPKFTASVLGLFGVMALTLAGLGVYGLLAYTVARRTAEIGVRMALGARPADVLRSVLGGTLRLVVAGIAIGLALSSVLVHLVERLLFGIEAADPMTFALAPVVLAMTAIVACLAPALRAVRVDPLVALRHT
jgi:predicted permease